MYWKLFTISKQIAQVVAYMYMYVIYVIQTGTTKRFEML